MPDLIITPPEVTAGTPEPELRLTELTRNGSPVSRALIVDQVISTVGAHVVGGRIPNAEFGNYQAIWDATNGVNPPAQVVANAVIQAPATAPTFGPGGTITIQGADIVFIAPPVTGGSPAPTVTLVATRNGIEVPVTNNRIVNGAIAGSLEQIYAATWTASNGTSPNANRNASLTVGAVATAPGQFNANAWSVTTGLSPFEVVLNINALPSDGGSGITRLQYEAGFGWTDLAGLGTGPRVLSMPLAGTNYSVRVRAANAVGFGAGSTAKSVTSGAEEVVTPPVEPSAGILAVGLNGITDYGASQPFINVLKASREWEAKAANSSTSHTSAQMRSGGHVDSDGNPLRIPSGASHLSNYILTEINAADTTLSGRYRISWTGDGDISVHGGQNVASGAGHVEFDYTPTGTNLIGLDITRINVNNPLKLTSCINLKHAAAFEDGEIFRPEWLAIVEDFSLFRFMDWQGTNNSTLSNWSDRPTPSKSTWSEGVPVEVMVGLCNKLGVNGWFCYPHLATDDYITRFAQYVRTNLRADLTAHYEFSNEVWNWQFDQAQWANTQGQALWPGQGDAWVQYYAGRSSEMSLLLDAVYGSQSNYRKVLSTQTGYLGLEAAILNAPNWVAGAGGRQAPSTYHDMYAVTGYFDIGLYGQEGADQIQQWRQAGSASAMQNMRNAMEESIVALTDQWVYHKGKADEAELKLVMYEGGSHIVPHGPSLDADRTLMPFLEDFHYSTHMGALYTQAMTAFRDVSDGAAFNIFVEVARSGPHGFWGGLRHTADSNPRWDAVTAFNAGNTVSPEEPGVFQRTASSPSDLKVHSGHSLTDTYINEGENWPGFLPELFQEQFGQSAWVHEATDYKDTLPGSPMRVRWNDASDARGAVLGIARYQTMVVTEAGPPFRIVNNTAPFINDTLEYAMNFAENAYHNGNGGNGAESILWSIWPNTEGWITTDPNENQGADWRDLGGFRPVVEEYGRTFRYIADYVTWKMKQRHPNLPADYRMWMFPGHAWMMQVYDDIQAGLVPGITDHRQLFRDDIHPTPSVAYALSVFMHTMLYQVDPRTLTYKPTFVSTALGAYFKEVAWVVATSEESVGMGGTENAAPVFVGGTMTDPMPDYDYAGEEDQPPAPTYPNLSASMLRPGEIPVAYSGSQPYLQITPDWFNGVLTQGNPDLITWNADDSIVLNAQFMNNDKRTATLNQAIWNSGKTQIIKPKFGMGRISAWLSSDNAKAVLAFFAYATENNSLGVGAGTEIDFEYGRVNGVQGFHLTVHMPITGVNGRASMSPAFVPYSDAQWATPTLFEIDFNDTRVEWYIGGQLVGTVTKAALQAQTPDAQWVTTAPMETFMSVERHASWAWGAGYVYTTGSMKAWGVEVANAAVTPTIAAIDNQTMTVGEANRSVPLIMTGAYSVTISPSGQGVTRSGTNLILDASAERNTTYTITARSITGQTAVRTFSLSVATAGAPAIDAVVVIGASHEFAMFGKSLTVQNAEATSMLAAAGHNLPVYGWATGGARLDQADDHYNAARSAFPNALIVSQFGGNNVSDSRPYPGGQTTFNNGLSGLLALANGDTRFYPASLTFRDYDDSTFITPANGSKPYNENLLLPWITTNFPHAMTPYGRPKLDLYRFVLNDFENLLDTDNIHFTPTGYAALKDYYIDRIADILSGTVPAEITERVHSGTPPVVTYPALTTAAGTPAYATGQFGQAMNSNATFWARASTSLTPLTAAWGMEAWVRIPTVSRSNIFMGESGSAVYGVVRASGSSPAGQACITYAGANGTTIQLTGGPRIDNNAWHHVAVQFRADGADLFVDGVLVASSAVAISATRVRGGAGTSNDSRFTVGHYASTTAFIWSGQVDEVRIWDGRELTAAFTPRTAAYTTLPTGTVAYWALDGDLNGGVPGSGGSTPQSTGASVQDTSSGFVAQG